MSYRGTLKPLTIASHNISSIQLNAIAHECAAILLLRPFPSPCEPLSLMIDSALHRSRFACPCSTRRSSCCRADYCSISQVVAPWRSTPSDSRQWPSQQWRLHLLARYGCGAGARCHCYDPRCGGFQQQSTALIQWRSTALIRWRRGWQINNQLCFDDD